MDWKKLLPESRKLRVMLATLIGYLLHCKFPFLSEDQIYVLLGIVGSWMGIQGISDHGAQGAAIAERRKQKGQPQLDPAGIIAAVKDGKVDKQELAFLMEQAGVLTELLATSGQVAQSTASAEEPSSTEASASIEESTAAEAEEEIEEEEAEEAPDEPEDVEEEEDDEEPAEEEEEAEESSEDDESVQSEGSVDKPKTARKKKRRSDVS